MTDERALCWQLLLPRDAVYETSGAPAWLTSLLNTEDLEDRPRVRVAWGEDAVTDGPMHNLEGLVVFNAAPSILQLRQWGFQYVRQYIALPSLQDVRWLLPVDHGTLAAASTTIPHPHRRAARLQRLVLMLLLKAGRLQTRSRLITVAAKRQPAIVRSFERLFPGLTFDLSISAGTPGPMRKPTVACFDRNGTPLAFAKVATTPAAEALIHNEAAVLRHIESEPRLRGIAPRLLAETTCDGRATVVQSVLTGRLAPVTLGEAHRDFLSALESDATYSVAAQPFVRALLDRLRWQPGIADECRPVVEDAVRALAGTLLPSTLMHGDFAPWNLRVQDDAIRAFDWEYGVVDGLPGLDELHHVWQTRTLLDKQEPALVVQALDALAITLPIGLDAKQARALVSLYLAHGLIHRFKLGCDDADPLVQSYRAALRGRPVMRAVLV